MLNHTETDTAETQPEMAEMAAMMAETFKRAALWEAVEAKISIKYTETEIVVGNAYQARNALKARGFRWEPTTKTWRFTLVRYSNITMRQGRVDNGRVHRYPEPVNWVVDVAQALGVA
jgi:hypothetical protein